MPRTAIPATVGDDVGASGLGVLPDAAGGICGPNDVVIIRNASGSSINITAKAGAGAGLPSGLTLPDRVLAVAAGAMARMGPFRSDYFARAAGAADAGKVYIDISLVTSVTWFAVTTRGVL